MRGTGWSPGVCCMMIFSETPRQLQPYWWRPDISRYISRNRLSLSLRGSSRPWAKVETNLDAHATMWIDSIPSGPRAVKNLILSLRGRCFLPDSHPQHQQALQNAIDNMDSKQAVLGGDFAASSLLNTNLNKAYVLRLSAHFLCT